MALRDDVERLQAVPPTQFTAARNRLVAEYRKAGRPSEARAVARLRRPTPALWAVNRLARTDRAGLASLIDAVDRLRRAQLRDPRVAADALRGQRDALEALVERARALLSDAGLAASPAIVRRLSDTLMGAASDRERVAALRRGELTEELAAPGFEAFSGAGATGPPLRLVRARPAPRTAAGGDQSRQPRAVDADRQRRVQEAERLERQAVEEQRSVARLEAERADARAKLTALEERLRTARRVAKRATAAASRARRKAGGSLPPNT